jgi:glutamate-1-semialdehyde 2,1-aminomutase
MPITLSSIEDRYRERTGRSRELMARAQAPMPGGSTRSLGHYPPYPVVMQRGEGPYLRDIDDNKYVDLVYNGLSLIHGHAYPPVSDALTSVLRRGSAWPGASLEQIDFAEQLCDRLVHVQQVAFTNSGTEAAMLAVKVARRATGRPLILKAWHGYHGSYDDLEVGLQGRGPEAGRVALARFGDLSSFKAQLDEHADQIAAVIVEPIIFTGVVDVPPDGFLKRLEEETKRAGALFILDDCLMLRLAVGGSAEKYGLEPDLTVLGKFIGGGLPMGVVGGRADALRVLDHSDPDHVYHGGSFNGNLLSCTAGAVSLRDLTAQRIALMDANALRLRSAIEEIASSHGLPLTTSGDGSAFGFYLSSELPESADEEHELVTMLHLACLNHGINVGKDHGQMFAAMATQLSDSLIEQVIDSFHAAFDDVAAWQEARG